MNKNIIQYDLSVIIPARNEEFLSVTVEKLLEKMRGNTEIIVVLDGAWAKPPIPQYERVNVIYVHKSIGQRAATNLGVRLSKGRYVMKLDAHTTWDEGCDIKMLEFFKKVGDDVTAVPIMRNLWMYDWKCKTCGKKWYQGPTPTKCQETNFRGTGKPCVSTRFIKKMMMVGKHNPQSTSYCFDSEPHFQYNEGWKHREPYITDKKTKGYTETMSLQGSCFMLTRENYWKWEVCDESLGSWGSQGLEVACATWLSGHRVLVNHSTWYAHLFRTKGDFSFPYPQSGNEVSRTKKRVKDKFWNKKYSKQIHPVSWLIKKFYPVKGWTDEDIKKLEAHEAKLK